MFANHGSASRQLPVQRWLVLAAILFSTFIAAGNAQAQNNFSSGSTGADGAFAPVASQSIPVPASGTFNFTTVNIPSGVTITFTRNSANKPLTILASGNVLIAGQIVVDGAPGNNSTNTGGPGGPGGSNGGDGGYGFDQSFSGAPGDGLGGGGGGTGGASSAQHSSGAGGGYGTAGDPGNSSTAAPAQAGPKYGATTILPLIGGSGGGGGGANNNGRGGGGGGGGGAILIASSGTTTLSGGVFARGGTGGSGNSGGGGGAGGAIRLISNTLTGAGSLNVFGGGGGGANFAFGGGQAGQGYVRLEAYDKSGFTGATAPANIASLSFPHPIAPPNSPSLRIASVGGVNAPASPAGSFQAVPDVIVPSSQPNPVTVALEGANIPVGTIIGVVLTPTRGNRTTVQSSGLAGTESASTASASVSLPGGISVITASAVIDLTVASAKPLFIDGERVNRIEVAATFGGPSELTYVTQSGRRIKRLAN